jgi:hypothetical protein
VWLPIYQWLVKMNVMSQLFVEDADEDDDGSLLASMEILFFGTMRQ